MLTRRQPSLPLPLSLAGRQARRAAGRTLPFFLRPGRANRPAPVPHAFRLRVDPVHHSTKARYDIRNMGHRDWHGDHVQLFAIPPLPIRVDARARRDPLERRRALRGERLRVPHPPAPRPHGAIRRRHDGLFSFAVGTSQAGSSGESYFDNLVFTRRTASHDSFPMEQHRADT